MPINNLHRSCLVLLLLRPYFHDASSRSCPSEEVQFLIFSPPILNLKLAKTRWIDSVSLHRLPSHRDPQDRAFRAGQGPPIPRKCNDWRRVQSFDRHPSIALSVNPVSLARPRSCQRPTHRVEMHRCTSPLNRHNNPGPTTAWTSSSPTIIEHWISVMSLKMFIEVRQTGIILIVPPRPPASRVRQMGLPATLPQWIVGE